MNHMPEQPTQEEIARCAYLIWEKEGRPHGRDMAHWIEAEEQLRADRLADAGRLVKMPPRPSRLAKANKRGQGLTRAPEPAPAPIL